jgi:predicted SprT family Zn-dependent metalloprotease
MDVTAAKLEPTPYHRAMVDYLRSQERELWKWFASAQAKKEYTEALRLALLKTTYRLDAEGHPELAQATEEAKAALGLSFPVTLYQAQQTNELNAALYFIPGEGHVVLSGPLLATLNPTELRSVLGHELAHYLLWQQDGGEFLVADRLLQAIADDPRAAPSHGQSAHRYRLYTEIYADRGSLAVTKDLHSVVSGLVKVETGLNHVSGASYLKQADEVFAQSNVKTEGLSHPEAFIRARALRLWSENGAKVEQQVAAMIEGNGEELDLVGQRRSTELVRRLLGQFLRPKWFQTEGTLAHARMFFSDFVPATVDDPGLEMELTEEGAKCREWLGYILLDFAVIDPELEDLPLACAWEWAKKLKIEAAFEKILMKELKMKARDLKKLKAEAAERVAKGEGGRE